MWTSRATSPRASRWNEVFVTVYDAEFMENAMALVKSGRTVADEGPGSPSLVSRAPGWPCQSRTPSVFVFNPFAEGYMAHGKAYTPVSHQAMLAADLANLPQFLCQPDDIVLLAKRPSVGFLSFLKRAGFQLPEFVELKEGRIEPASSLCQRKLGSLRPWA